MALKLDTSKQLRSVTELTELVQAIAAAPLSESEPVWLEWKREADLTERQWHVIIAKCIAGFANRDPIVARQWASGCAYMVVGAEPSNVMGVNPVDNANLHAGISRYVRPSVRWSAQYVQYQGKQVLIVIVEPPEHGDRVVAMLSDYQPEGRGGSRIRRGDVFIRRHGRTDLAGQDDYDMLASRFAGGAERVIGLSVQAFETVTAVPVAFDTVSVATWCKREEREFLEPLETAANPQIGLPFLQIPERRSPDEYRSAVEAYLSDMASLLPYMARVMALRDRSPSMRLLVVNETDRNFAGARIEVHIEGDVWAYQTAEDAMPDVPPKPRKWGTIAGPDFFSPSSLEIPTSDIFGPNIDNSGSAGINFPDIDLRPIERVKLHPVHLIADPALAGATLMAKWEATSSSSSGVARGEIPIKVEQEVLTFRVE